MQIAWELLPKVDKGGGAMVKNKAQFWYYFWEERSKITKFKLLKKLTSGCTLRFTHSQLAFGWRVHECHYGTSPIEGDSGSLDWNRKTFESCRDTHEVWRKLDSA